MRDSDRTFLTQNLRVWDRSDSHHACGEGERGRDSGCVCVRETETERVCVWVCERERGFVGERERKRETNRKRGREKNILRERETGPASLRISEFGIAPIPTTQMSHANSCQKSEVRQNQTILWPSVADNAKARILVYREATALDPLLYIGQMYLGVHHRY